MSVARQHAGCVFAFTLLSSLPSGIAAAVTHLPVGGGARLRQPRPAPPRLLSGLSVQASNAGTGLGHIIQAVVISTDCKLLRSIFFLIFMTDDELEVSTEATSCSSVWL